MSGPAETLLAFTFANPWMLTGLVAVSVPILIHFLRRHPRREIEWAAMRFLMDALHQQSRRARLEQWLLLAVRVLLVSLLVFALAEPVLDTSTASLNGKTPTARLLVLDTSCSMAYQNGFRSGAAGASRFAKAKNMAHKIVAQAPRGDAFFLLRLSGSEPRVLVRRPVYDKSSVQREIDRLSLSDERGDVFATLDQLANLVDNETAIPQKEIVVISDFQKTSWLPQSADSREMIRSRLQQLAQKAKLVLLDVGQATSENAAVTEFVAEESPAIVDQPIQLRATVRNFGFIDRSDQKVELFVDEHLADVQHVDLPAESDVEISFACTFDMEGEHQLAIHLQDGALPNDNHRWLALPVTAALRVLLVNGRPVGPPEDSATYYVETALAPSASHRSWQNTVRPDSIAYDELPETGVATYDCIFLCNVPSLIETDTHRLRRFVENGGGLVIGLGDQVDPTLYNELLFNDGQSILPARLEARVGNVDEMDDLFHFDRRLLDHPIVRLFRGNPDAGLGTSITFAYIRVTVPAEMRSRIVLQFTTGDPAIVAQPLGRGFSILVTTSFDKRWGTWPVWATSFVPLIHELVRYSVSGRSTERQLIVGQPITRVLSERFPVSPITVTLPDGKERALMTLSDSGSPARFTYDGTSQSGIYVLKLGHTLNRSEMYAVNIDSRESDLSRLSHREITSMLPPGTLFDQATQPQTPVKSSPHPAFRTDYLSRVCLLLVLALLLIEPMIAGIIRAIQPRHRPWQSLD